MSEKKAKEQRKLNNTPQQTVSIDLFSDGHVEVRGFPVQYPMAMEVMVAGVKRVSQYFVMSAKAGMLNDNMVVEKPRIIQPGNIGDLSQIASKMNLI